MISLKTVFSKRKPVNVFIAEIIICLLFFIISSAVIMKVFAAADSRLNKSSELERAVICAESLAEIYSPKGDFSEAARLVFGEQYVGMEQFTLDGRCNYDESGEIVLTADETQTSAGTGILKKLTLTFSKNDTVIYTLDCAAYIGGNSDE